MKPNADSFAEARPAITAPISPLSLLALCLGYFMVMIDVTIVNVALPALGQDLQSDVSGLQWVLDSYTLIFASLLLSAGHFADRMGARRAFNFGLGLFAVSSLACGVSPNIMFLIAGRVLQGLAAAVVMPTSLALINVSYQDKAGRAQAVGIWGAMGGVAAACGPPLGGLLTAGLGWRAVFLVNVPIGLVGMFLAARYVVSPLRQSRLGMSFADQGAAVICLAGLAVALIEAGRYGWTSQIVLVGFAVALISGVTFILIERRSPNPMLPLSLFRSSTFSASLAVGMAINIGFYGELFMLPLYFQGVRNYSALLTALAILPQPGICSIAAYLGGRMTSRVGPRLPAAIGLLTGAAGLMALLMAGETGPSYIAFVLPLAAVGFGTAFTMPAVTIAAMEASPASRAGVSSGALNASRQVGSLIGVALLGTFVALPGGFLPGFHLAAMVGSGVFLGAFVLALAFLDNRSSDKPRPGAGQKPDLATPGNLQRRI
jgi:DHA2 family methylenomycin A resistance protein-like MFS transporter